MFNIAQSGNIVNIDSPDVEFDITVSLISGTSFQVANIEAIGYSWEVTSSGTVANVKLIGGAFLRNGYLMDVEMNTPSRTLTPLAETSNLIFEYDNSDGAYIYNVVAVANYIYFYYYNTDGYMYLVEYDKDTDTTIELQIAQGLAYVFLNGSCGGGIAWIEGRKILCVSDNDDDWTGLFVVDFSTSTVDRVEEMIAPMTVRSTIINNHILLVAFGYGTTGWEIYYLDYTAGGSWTQVLIPFTGNEALLGHYPFFVSNNYLVWFVSRINPDSPYYPQVQAWSFNLNTYAVQYSSWVDTGAWANKAMPIRSASSSAYGKAYATASGLYQGIFAPYQYFDCWYEYVPFTNSLTLIYSLEMDAAEFPWSVVFSTTTTTYIWNWYTEQFENVAAIGAGLGSLSRGVDYWYVYNQYSYLMDDNSNRALVCDGGNLKTVSAIGEGGQTIALSGIYHIHHIKYALVAHTISGDTERLYLIT